MGNLHTDGTLQAIFSSSPSGDFYISVKGRNMVQTWSAVPQVVGTTPLFYDFTDASSKAYGNNMIEVATGVWAFYSGDLNQDDLVDTQDYVFWEAKYLDSAFGEEPTDLNGDGIVDTQDYTIWEGNYLSSVFAAYPF
ncbi:MAG: hypothetical protein IPN80_11975 [Flavobacterium sp.]|nr:hypothetical protein [Flavobacterium sp.]